MSPIEQRAAGIRVIIALTIALWTLIGAGLVVLL